MRNLITEYVNQEKSLINVSKAQAKGVLAGVEAKDVLTRPQDFKNFILERAINRFADKVLQNSMQAGYEFGQKLTDLSKKQIKQQVKVGKA